MSDVGASDAERAALFRAAVTNHSKISLEAKIGKGMDRHMFALRDVALRRAGGVSGDAALPAIFTDPAHAALGEVILSTSTLSSDALVGGGFGPVGPQCYALGCVERCPFLVLFISPHLTHTHARTHTAIRCAGTGSNGRERASPR
jgi:carnitine O-palmitoyltransferase 2